ncbi:hypothetical protein P154DRAFT_542350 [Amniculicola lignicola CBS 123094]|uniref:Mediator of RNA polymerase II transcription subunit 4 n=1 Tax=Amniculicola lignicola CBS 123094 TaxID=1392246 RepID=A0A6A5WW39_9PLEO|nr:hypothetical protein P154DRAFT_542350 [Amniculicola lignicola CBS 123094]
MDDILDAQFQRVETALNTLVESIASYNPSIAAATDLVAADDALSSGLEQLSQHQENHKRIITLRAEAEALETHLKTSVTTLASLRHELFETPATALPEDSHAVPVDELLQYAKTLAAYTIPPTYREPVSKDQDDADKDKDNASAAEIPSQGAGTPAITAPTTSVDEPMKDAADEDPKREVTAEEAEWYKKLTAGGWTWYPWPDEFKINSGNLARIQELKRLGFDPWTTTTDVLEPSDGQPGVEGGQPIAQVADMAERETAPAGVPKEPVVAAPRPPEQPAEKFSGFDLDDDSD